MSDYFSFSHTLTRPGLVHGTYPQRQEDEQGGLEQAVEKLLVRVTRNEGRWKRRFTKILQAIHVHGDALEHYDKVALEEEIKILRQQLYQGGLNTLLLARSFAVIREVSGRTLGMHHYDVQLMGGWVMLQGGLAEMETGEGKTLTAILPAATAAFAGTPVHVITVNDYLARRDAELMAPVYEALGLAVGVVTEEMDGAARRAAYACDITYCTNKQVAFDYLRDRLAMGNDAGCTKLAFDQLTKSNVRSEQLYLRGLCFAIIDEADSVLVDEAKTPLIISRSYDSDQENQLYREAMELALKLRKAGYFRVDTISRQVDLSEPGIALLAEMSAAMGPMWQGSRRREDLVTLALAAEYLYRRDHEYLVQDGKVVIVDANTGRTMADRSWENGLQQMIEIKENCDLTEKREPLARITYQRFFRRYLRIAGMSGTVKEIQDELYSVYGLHVHTIATHQPCLRHFYGHRLYANKKSKREVVVKQIQWMQKLQRPVLVGTRSVAELEQLSEILAQEDIAHQVLHARQNSHEAEVIAGAGQRSQITLATNMAGRGTDIPLGQGVAELGGLHVICCEQNEAGRIDRQLSGRCARQGDPGSFEYILSMEDELVIHYGVTIPFEKLFLYMLKNGSFLAGKLGVMVMSMAQRGVEKRHRMMRRNLMRLDAQLGKTLSFSGRME